jgi:NADH-quinone oxidoreductase subunit C
VALAATLLEAVDGCDASDFWTPSAPGVRVDPGKVIDVLRFLRDDPGQRYESLVDITVVDHVALDAEFHVVYVLRSYEGGPHALIVKAAVPADDPAISSATELWKGANWAEREAWDMFGVRFEGHPDLRRILMYEPFDGHPLRKSYPVDRRQPLVEERDPIANPWPSRDRY